MLFLSFLILLLIVPQSCPTSVPSQISPSITKISPSITVPISIPPDTIDFTIPPGTNPSTSLTHFASTHHLAPPHIAELSNYVRKQALLAGHIPHTRIIEVPESATVDEYTIHYEPLISCLTDPSYDYTIQRTHSVALPPTFATTLALTSTSICLPPHRDGGIQVDVFLVYARMQYSYTGNFSTAIIMETKAGKVTHWDPHWDPHDPHWDPHWDPLSPAISPTLAISPYLPSTPPPPPPAASNPSITLLLVSHDGGTNTTYAVFHDVITALTHTLTALNQPTNFRLCSSLLDPLCSSASLHELAQTSTIVVIAPHTLVRVTADDVPVVLKTAYLPATTILYNYEVVPAVANQGSGSAVSEEVVELYRRYTTWDYCEANVETLKQHGVTATVVPLGFALVDLPKRGAEDIDVLFYGTVTGYRRSVIDELRAGGVKVSCAGRLVYAGRTCAVKHALSNTLIIHAASTRCENTLREHAAKHAAPSTRTFRWSNTQPNTLAPFAHRLLFCLFLVPVTRVDRSPSPLLLTLL